MTPVGDSECGGEKRLRKCYFFLFLANPDLVFSISFLFSNRLSLIFLVDSEFLTLKVQNRLNHGISETSHMTTATNHELSHLSFPTLKSVVQCVSLRVKEAEGDI